MNGTVRLTRFVNMFYMQRLKYSKLPTDIVVATDKNMIVCWHPEQEFPYEHTLPLPERKSASTNSVLHIGEKEIAEVFKSKRKDVIVEELAKMTYTTKHRWYPRSRDKKAKKTLPDRPYL